MTLRAFLVIVEQVLIDAHGPEKVAELLEPAVPQPERLRVDPVAVAAMGGVMH